MQRAKIAGYSAIDWEAPSAKITTTVLQALWQETDEGDKPKIKIPQSVVVEDTMVTSWYFTSQKGVHAGTVLRKSKVKLTDEAIVEGFVSKTHEVAEDYIACVRDDPSCEWQRRLGTEREGKGSERCRRTWS